MLYRRPNGLIFTFKELFACSFTLFGIGTVSARIFLMGFFPFAKFRHADRRIRMSCIRRTGAIALLTRGSQYQEKSANQYNAFETTFHLYFR